ncbi:hypothetical protein NUW58_g304 [Xylaria curta]|uniref:Uncharacterized protein n=1 Tax=Xylaria curta TaxID=42375 RepID=A0ACC1PR58_9PEZI|nr:hypothetical protein NUW58_g304 [Xylaria curta]
MSDIFEVEAANFLAFVGAQPPKPDSVFLLVMGMTGSGKSSFIADCTGRDDAKIGHDLESCTNSVAIFCEELQERDVYLIDTPGFDFKDTNREDVEILTAVAHYLSVSYANNVSINGIFYLHRISDTRIGSSTKRNLEMMRALCGEDAFENVAIITTMWASDHSEVELAKQRNREQELRDIYLRDMIAKGSHIIRHDRCITLSERRASANDILTTTFDRWKDTQVTLQIQHEMVDLNLALKDTSAGKVLERYIREHQNSYENELEQLGLSSNPPYDASDETQLHTQTLALRDVHQSGEIHRILAANNQALEAMRLSLVEIHNKQEQQFLDRVSVMEAQWKESLRQMEDEYRLKELHYRTRQLEEQEKASEEKKPKSQELQDSPRLVMTVQSTDAYGKHSLTQRQEVSREQRPTQGGTREYYGHLGPLDDTETGSTTSV